MPQQKPRHPHIRYFILCEETKISDDGRFDCVNVFDDLAVPAFPSDVKLEIVVGLDRLPGDREYKLSFLLEDPSGGTRQSPPITIPAKIDDPTPTYIMAATLRFSEEGKHMIHIQFDETVAEA